MLRLVKMEWILLVVGVVVGGAGGIFIGKQSAPQEPIIIEAPPTGVEVGTQLADIDLVQVPCSTEFIDANGDLLCRELFCRMQQRGIDAQTSSADCAAISNINNSIKIIKLIENACSINTAETDQFNKCAQRYKDIIVLSKSGQ